MCRSSVNPSISAYYSQQVQSIPGEPRRRNKFPRKGHIYKRGVWTCQLGLQQVMGAKRLAGNVKFVPILPETVVAPTGGRILVLIVLGFISATR